MVIPRISSWFLAIKIIITCIPCFYNKDKAKIEIDVKSLMLNCHQIKMEHSKFYIKKNKKQKNKKNKKQNETKTNES